MIDLKETPTLKLGQTPVMTVPQVCVFGNLRQETIYCATLKLHMHLKMHTIKGC